MDNEKTFLPSYLSTTAFALGAMVLGATGAWFAEFALQWQPVPPGLPDRALFARITGVILLVLAISALVPRTSAWGVRALCGAFMLWACLLNLPKLLAHWQNIGSSLSFFEILAIASAALVVVAPSLNVAWRRKVGRGAQIAFGCCAVVFGVCHFVYLDFTASMVPGWLPWPKAWAFATGVGHAAAGVAVLLGRLQRAATTSLSGMIGCFVVLVHLPRVFNAPHAHIEWVMLGISLTLAGATWAMSRAIHADRAQRSRVQLSAQTPITW